MIRQLLFILTGFVKQALRFILFSFVVLKSLITHRPDFTEMLRCMYEVGIESLPVIFAVAFFVGMSMMIQGYYVLHLFGGQSFLGLFIGLACLRELGPIVVGAMVASKSGSDMAAQIAVMRLKSQIDALEVMSIDPVWYLITPRLLAMVLMLPLLVVLANSIIILSSLVIAHFELHMNPTQFFNNLFRYVGLTEMFYGMIKGAVFGCIIGLISCFQGFTAQQSPEGVGRATNRAIVQVTAISVVINYIMSQVMYGR